MKIIHTSDWHLGHRLYNFDNAEEECHFLRQVEETVSEEQPDALVVSGDIFDNVTPGNDTAKRFTDAILSITGRCPTMETVIIAGNHDSYSRLVVDKELWLRARVHIFGMPGEDNEGRAVFEKNTLIIPGKGVIAAVPFCHSRNFPAVDGADTGNREENYFRGLAKYVAGIAGGLPRVLAAHLAVKGDIDFSGQDKSMVIGGAECVDVKSLGEGYSYIALGHIHCPQWIKGEGKVARYCGTPRAVSFDETYAHGVDVVKIEKSAPPEVATKKFDPLNNLMTVGGKEGLEFESLMEKTLESDLPENTYVRLNVRLGANEVPGPDWTERARAACASKGYRFCVINPIRAGTVEQPEKRRKITVAELKELSDDEVLDILSARHELTRRQRQLIGNLMEGLRP
jgi:exonuclease SbcD